MTPQVRVLRGSPDEFELAALVAGIVAGRAPGADDDAVARRARRAALDRRRWVDGAQQLRGTLARGGDAWRWSGRA
ncbi:acyl-CoA carboxylase subunit epsilon [Actinotalea fermentans]|uniref:Acyl-CoA carboxylase subunit epsilon n=1 Tax=Actinotalea fermentans TaxID=43671 RepID=A0A511YWJ6_9CELL|nr:acyl-CoA carboxylase subunit epsilon [Actinotalea fermentans]GEN79584.1 hypothetical protein AFE02nite_13180 [Actinotalea fermentans]